MNAPERAPGEVAGMRRVPQAWIDRAMQIEAAADVLYAHARDAISRAQGTPGRRFYTVNMVQVESAMEEVALALNTPEPIMPAKSSQGLDAATVERCAQEAEKARETAISLGFVKRTGVAADRIGAVGMKIAARIRALATEPHRHGGKA